MNLFTVLNNNPEYVEILSDNARHMTLFAPTDEAFGKLKPITLESLLDGSSCLDGKINE